MLILLIIFLALILFFYWNSSLLFHKERESRELTSDESKCFSPRCRSIIYENGNEKAVLFIHGFPTTPYMYAYPAREFSRNGYDVFSPLLPTFGTDYKEFEQSIFPEWFGFIDRYYLSLKKRYKDVYVIGVSMGGAMTLKIAELHRDSESSPKAIAVLAAPVAYNSLIRDGFVTSWSFYIGRIVAMFAKEIGAGYVDGKPGAEDGNDAWVGYSGTFPRQGISLVYNLKSIRKNLGSIRVPLISIHDKGDKTVPFGNQKIITGNVSSRKVKVISDKMPNFNHTHHSLLMYNSTRAKYTEEILKFFAEV